MAQGSVPGPMPLFPLRQRPLSLERPYAPNRPRDGYFPRRFARWALSALESF